MRFILVGGKVGGAENIPRPAWGRASSHVVFPVKGYFMAQGAAVLSFLPFVNSFSFSSRPLISTIQKYESASLVSMDSLVGVHVRCLSALISSFSSFTHAQYANWYVKVAIRRTLAMGRVNVL